MQLIGTSVRLADLRTSRTSAVGPQRPVSGLAVFFFGPLPTLYIHQGMLPSKLVQPCTAQALVARRRDDY